MKNLITLLLTGLFFTSGVYAQGLITLQSGDNATFYTNLDSALYYAQDGDDIYLPGGNIKTSDPLKINKAVNLMGVGYNLSSNLATLNTRIESSSIEIGPNVTGGSISGIYAKNANLFIHDNVSNFLVNRCYVNILYLADVSGFMPPSGIHITETVILTWIQGNCTANPPYIGPQDISINNCIIGGIGANAHWENLVCKNTIIANSHGSALLYNIITNSVFENCIFTGFDNLGVQSNENIFKNCLFSNNITFSETPLTFSCIFEQTPESIFIDPQDFVFNMKNDFRLQENSPGKNAGSDGTDIGIYGGRFPWKDGGLPINPHIESKFVNGTTNHDGTLNVQVKVAAQER